MALFPLGQIVASHDVAHLTDQERKTVLDRHRAGDWGDVPDELREQNARALTSGGALYSAYQLASGRVVLIQTEGDRRSSLMRLADEDMTSKWRTGARLFIRMTTTAFVKELFGR
jgi:hypothetical protein